MALDRITKALVVEFLNDSGIASKGDEKDFEYFTTFINVSPHVEAGIPYAEVVCGDGNDTAIDSIAIIVNGEIVEDIGTVQDLVDAGATLDVHFIFTQSKVSTSFSTAVIGQIQEGVCDFFAEDPLYVRNESIQHASAIAQLLYENARLFRSNNPICSVYYVTPGRLAGDNDLTKRRKKAEENISSLNLFSKTTFTLIDATGIQSRYRNVKHGLERTFSFTSKVAFPEMEGVTEAHIGFIAATDLLQLLEDEEGNLTTSVFYDNVRDFQGLENPVNSEISTTLETERRSRFALMNNGVTIIAKELKPVGQRFHVRDFQVVNGCQTTNVLWTRKEQLNSDVTVPLRLISSQDEDTIIDIIRATNRQTEVREEQFFATNDYLKSLETYFETLEPQRRLFLERRSKQHANTATERTRIVPFNHLVRSFASLVLDEPHRATRNYKQVLERIPADILNPEHKPEVYFAAASSLYRLEFLFRNKTLDRKYSPAKYHLLTAVGRIVSGRRPSRLNGKDAITWANKLVEAMWDAAKSERLFLQAAQDVEKLAGGNLDREEIRTQGFTGKLTHFYDSPQHGTTSTARKRG